MRYCWRGMRFQAAFAEKVVHPRIHRQPENLKRPFPFNPHYSHHPFQAAFPIIGSLKPSSTK
ncbi:hypothetical protein [Kingella oralis]|uniref:Uncharacterized protein n=1 Tax=Kingella oralis ATCC 51147 TaxID=629741 RepID=C4GFD9_9NEIS|nr:hypothetical protein [Kingella oralis]EEP68944.1 hypothetical protein GCWU000324_00855 [Kingella oralis ATCC 51147]QMT41892.1 hypothetical protein H3L93_07495 [Kingella oralis]